MRKTFNDPRTVKYDFDSVTELADMAALRMEDRYGHYGADAPLDRPDFYGDMKTPGEALYLARDGWGKHLDATLDIVHDAVEEVEREFLDTAFTPQWSVSGGMVDMGAYLAGEPECMIEFPPVKTSKTGRVVTVCASVSVSGWVTADMLVLKGQVVTALALELERMGMNTELYADMSATGSGGYMMTHRVLVKGPNDVLDPARILFAFAHPGMLRVLSLSAMHDMDEVWQARMEVGSGYGIPHEPLRDLPDGTLYLPETLYTGEDINPAVLLQGYLRELGVIQ